MIAILGHKFNASSGPDIMPIPQHASEPLAHFHIHDQPYKDDIGQHVGKEINIKAKLHRAEIEHQPDGSKTHSYHFHVNTMDGFGGGKAKKKDHVQASTEAMDKNENEEA
jgi:hypothetical protein